MKQTLKTLLQQPELQEGRDWRRLRLETNQYVFREGDAADTIYLVTAGTVRIIADLELEEGRRIQPGVCDLGIGEVFGELALFGGEPRSASVMTVSDCELVCFSGAQLLAFFDSHPAIGYQVLRELVTTLIDRLRTTNKKLSSILAWGLKARGLDGSL